MENLKLQPISILDIEWLDKTEYKGLSEERRKELVKDSDKGLYNGEFFRFFIVKRGAENVGVINMRGHGKEVVSVAPEILKEFRGRGFGEESLKIAYSLAKELGFREITAGIREDNLVSINLHLKLGFKYVKEHASKNGNVLKIYSKLL